MHAVSQEPEPCIYAQLEATVGEDDTEDDCEEELYPEIRLVPRDAATCECALHLEYATQGMKLVLTAFYAVQCRPCLKPSVSVLLSIQILMQVS